MNSKRKSGYKIAKQHKAEDQVRAMREAEAIKAEKKTAPAPKAEVTKADATKEERKTTVESSTPASVATTKPKKEKVVKVIVPKNKRWKFSFFVHTVDKENPFIKAAEYLKGITPETDLRDKFYVKRKKPHKDNRGDNWFSEGGKREVK